MRLILIVVIVFCFKSHANGYLPMEIYQQIGQYCHPQVKRNAMEVNQLLNRVTRWLLSEIKIVSIPFFKDFSNWISTFPNIRTLRVLGTNQFPFQHLTTLTKLQTFDMALAFLGPPQQDSGNALSYLTHLKRLRLQSTSKINTFHISSLHQLLELSIYFDRCFTGFVLHGLTNLRQLSIRACPRVSPSDLSMLVQLTKLTFDTSHCSPDSLRFLSELSSLRRLVLFKCENFSPETLQWLTLVTTLTHLALHEAKNITLSSCTSLQGLKVDLCDLGSSFELPSSITRLQLDIHADTHAFNLGHLSHLLYLKHLKIHADCFSDLNTLAFLTTLTSLQLHHYSTRLPDTLDTLSSLSHLKILELGRHQDINLSHLHTLHQLESLFLSENWNLTNLQHLSFLKNLTSLTLEQLECVETLLGISHLPLLYCLQINALPQLSSLTDLQDLPSLETVRLRHCHSLKSATSLFTLPRLCRLYIDNCKQMNRSALFKKQPSHICLQYQ